MTLSVSTFSDLLKEYYTKHPVAVTGLEKDPFYTMLKKNTAWGGMDQLRIGVQYGFAQNVSAAAATSYAGTADASVDAFYLKRARKFNKASLNRELMLASRDELSLLKSTVAQIDGAAKAVARAISVELFRDSSGAIGQISSINSSTITLTNPKDAINFEIGMKVTTYASKSYATGSSPSSTDDGNSLTVQNINYSAGTVTLSASTGLTNSDYVFPVGTKAAALSGLEAWCPATAPSAGESFWTVDRSVHVERLAGSRVDATTGMSLTEALIEGAAAVSTHGGKVDTFFVSFDKWSALTKLLQGAAFQEFNVGKIGFDSIVITVPGGKARVVCSNACPSDRIFGVNMDALELVSIGETVQFADEDSKLLREANADSFEVRVASYCNLACYDPSCLVNIKVNA